MKVPFVHSELAQKVAEHRAGMPKRDIIVIGASLGGIDALKALTATLPSDLPAAILIVVHIAPSSPGILPVILQQSGTLSASIPANGEAIRPGHIFVAPPDQHMLLDESGSVRLAHGPKENLARPAIDPLFRSASIFGSRVIGVILTGGLDDGSAGLWSIKQQGGTALVQHPNDALAPSMPLNAMLRVAVDYCVPLSEIGPLLGRLTKETIPRKEKPLMSEQIRTEIKVASGEKMTLAEIKKLGVPSSFACPECHGVLSQINEQNISRFRCHTGHAYSLQSLLTQYEADTEESLWNTIRSIEERMMLLQKAAEELRLLDEARSVESLQKATELEGQLEVLRKIVMFRKN
jgi:two-component system chemotaxis response regulator CheB